MPFTNKANICYFFKNIQYIKNFAFSAISYDVEFLHKATIMKTYLDKLLRLGFCLSTAIGHSTSVVPLLIFGNNYWVYTTFCLPRGISVSRRIHEWVPTFARKLQTATPSKSRYFIDNRRTCKRSSVDMKSFITILRGASAVFGLILLLLNIFVYFFVILYDCLLCFPFYFSLKKVYLTALWKVGLQINELYHNNEPCKKLSHKKGCHLFTTE